MRTRKRGKKGEDGGGEGPSQGGKRKRQKTLEDGGASQEIVRQWLLWRSRLAGREGKDESREESMGEHTDGYWADMVELCVAAQCQVPSALCTAVLNRWGDLNGEDAGGDPPPTLEEMRAKMAEDPVVVRTWGPRRTLHLLRADNVYNVARGASHIGDIRKRMLNRGDNLRVASADLIDADVAAITRVLAEVGPEGLPKSDFKAHGLNVNTQYSMFQILVYSSMAVRSDVKDTSAPTLVPYPSIGPVTSDPEEAFDMLATEYFRTYGPADERDFRYWLGARKGETTPVVARLEDRGILVPVQCSGEEKLILGELKETFDAFVGGGGWAASPGRTPVVRLLGRFEPLILAHKDKSIWVDKAHYKKVWYYAEVASGVTVDGKIVGKWKRTPKSSRSHPTLSVDIFPFSPSAAAMLKTLEDPIQVQVDRLGRFYGHPEGGEFTFIS